MILVTGDVVLDHNIYAGARLSTDAPGGNGSHYLSIAGGAMLTYGLLEKLLSGEARFGLAQRTADELGSWPEQFHSRALWHAVANEPKEGYHWALERNLGYGNPPTPPAPYPGAPAADLNSVSPEILVLDDGGLGFRENEACWPQVLTRAERPQGLEWVVLKMSRPLASGKLWRALIRNSWRERLIVIVNADQLRGEGMRVAGGLSWERTVDDICQELEMDWTLRGLTHCRHLIVTMRSDAALWLEHGGRAGSTQVQLVFDRSRCEGEWEEQNRNWKAYGFLSSVTASVSWSVSKALEEKRAKKDTAPVDHVDLTFALAAGLSATRFLREHGHGPAGAEPRFPFKAAAEHLESKFKEYREEQALPYAVAQIDRPQGSGTWTILGSISPWHASTGRVSFEPARRVAVYGPDRLRGAPCARFQKLQTLDRHEIDGLRALRQLMLMYRDSGPQKQPLCLAVFGTPGSGKSFGLKQAAAGVFGEKNPILEFNLSQFADGRDLTGAYHQVRDKVLSGATPVVFWDEFDSRSLEWLQYFLAPMQDGAFQAGQLTHFVGKSVFVFAGGTSHSYKEFTSPDNRKDFELKKGPDFVSRISGYLDIAGPNPRKGSRLDREFPVRRAVIIRSILGLGDSRLQIEPGLLTALLGVTAYRNGARSLEKLVRFIRDRGGMPLRRAYLPPDEILGLYVADVKQFHDLTRKYAGFYAQADSLAPEIHKDWLTNLKEPERATNPNAKPWEEVTQETRESNFAAALRIPGILEVAGLTLEEGSGTTPEVQKILNDNLDPMAEAEHGGWEEQKRIDGWTYSPYRLDAARRHDLLIPYKELLESSRKKDKNTIEQYIKYAGQAGFRIVPLKA